MSRRPAIYARVSTDDQDEERQVRDCLDYLGVEIGDVRIYRDREHGDVDSRKDFRRLISDIESGEVELVGATEVSRLSRSAATFGEFLELALDNGVGLEILENSFPSIEPDSPWSKAMAQIAAVFAELEHSMINARIRSGIKNAKHQGKWTGRPPKGFKVGDDGFLEIDGEEFVRVQAALEEVEAGESVYSVSKSCGVPESTLKSILRDEDKRRLYLEGEAEDERVAEALE